MKVIKPSESLRITCSNCGAVLELSKEDIKVREVMFQNIYFCNCPCCSSEESIETAKIPLRWIGR